MTQFEPGDIGAYPQSGFIVLEKKPGGAILMLFFDGSKGWHRPMDCDSLITSIFRDEFLINKETDV